MAMAKAMIWEITISSMSMGTAVAMVESTVWWVT